MEHQAFPDPRLRFEYDFMTPTILGSARAKKTLNVLIARTTLTEDEALRLARIQLAKWYCDDLADDIGLRIILHVSQNAEVLRQTFDRLGVEHNLIPDIDEHKLDDIAKIALELNCDVIVATDAARLRELLNDDIALVGEALDDALHAVEIHMKGFDAPWSFEFAVKNQPWTNFYMMCEQSMFSPLLEDLSDSAKANAEVAEVMRSLLADALPSMCFNRDRVEFYRQQDRWAERAGLERQEFRFEYTTALNLFYLTLYGAVDQVAALTVHFYNLEVEEKDIGALYAAFRNARAAIPGMDEVFSDSEFWEMYRIPKLIRHKAAHRGPVTPQTIYYGEDHFTDAQLDAAAEQYGFFDDLHFLEKVQLLPEEVRLSTISMARFKAKLKLLGKPMKHVLFLKDGKKGLFYNPDPAGDLERFVAFLHRVLNIIKPWDKLPQTTSAAANESESEHAGTLS